MNFKLTDILMVLIMIAILIVMVIAVYWMQGQGGKCISNPINYTKNLYPDAFCGCFRAIP